ncbi:hypothetical protein EVAR_26696_1 [Eumeta japonica]|uniref:Uncharacterized protein n=1 Tax=Eumeta variegata TaxID=151549 RepID=A0A4C1VLU2_EUMVA|nr:hypothetical protein EVAR_26696_1 [Eumeta japonica]
MKPRGLWTTPMDTLTRFERRQEFITSLDNLFDIAHADALQLIKINEDRIFLERQREPGRPSHLAGVDKKLSDKEEKLRLRNIKEQKRQANYYASLTASTSSHQEKSSSDAKLMEVMDSQDELSTPTEIAQADINKTSTSKNFITPKLVTALDRCQLSMRNSVYIIEATSEALGLNTDEYSISKSTIQTICTKKRKERAEAIKVDSQNDLPDTVTVH